MPLIHDHVLPADLWEREVQRWWELGGVQVPGAAHDGSVMLEQLKEALRAEYAGNVPSNQERVTLGWETRGSLPGWLIPVPLRRRP